MSITQTTAGWSFIRSGRRYTYPTRELAREALYDLQRGIEPQIAATPVAEVAAAAPPRR
jgi:hypothetical protein